MIGGLRVSPLFSKRGSEGRRGNGEMPVAPFPPGYPRTVKPFCRAASALHYVSQSVAVDGPRAKVALKWLLKLAKRVCAAQALTLAVIAICVLAGLPAILTAFLVALVEFIANIYVAVRTLGPVFRKFLLRGQ